MCLIHVMTVLHGLLFVINFNRWRSISMKFLDVVQWFISFELSHLAGSA